MNGNNIENRHMMKTPHKPGSVINAAGESRKAFPDRVPWIPLIRRESNRGCDDALSGSGTPGEQDEMQRRQHHKMWNHKSPEELDA